MLRTLGSYDVVIAIIRYYYNFFYTWKLQSLKHIFFSSHIFFNFKIRGNSEKIEHDVLPRGLDTSPSLYHFILYRCNSVSLIRKIVSIEKYFLFGKNEKKFCSKKDTLTNLSIMCKFIHLKMNFSRYFWSVSVRILSILILLEKMLKKFVTGYS